MLCSVLPWTIPPVLMASSTTSAQVTVAAAFCLSFRPMHSKSGRPSKASLTDLLLPNASGLVNGTTSHLAPSSHIVLLILHLFTRCPVPLWQGPI